MDSTCLGDSRIESRFREARSSNNMFGSDELSLDKIFQEEHQSVEHHLLQQLRSLS
jgi:hypothetical protein